MAVHFGTLDFKAPLMFVDGSSVWDQFLKDHIVHKKGYFIMAPSGVGKTYFLERQKEKHWVDGDTLWEKTNAHPKGEWWTWGGGVIETIDQRSDVVTIQAKMLGLWVIGASNAFMPPDAIVIPHWSTHKKYIAAREKGNYDGGATIDRLSQVLWHRNWIMKWRKKGVPQFKSVQEATDFLAKRYAEEFKE